MKTNTEIKEDAKLSKEIQEENKGKQRNTDDKRRKRTHEEIKEGSKTINKNEGNVDTSKYIQINTVGNGGKERNRRR